VCSERAALVHHTYMPPKGKSSGKGAGSKGKGADGDVESSSGSKQAKGGTAVKVPVIHKLLLFG